MSTCVRSSIPCMHKYILKLPVVPENAEEASRSGFTPFSMQLVLVDPLYYLAICDWLSRKQKTIQHTNPSGQ